MVAASKSKIAVGAVADGSDSHAAVGCVSNQHCRTRGVLNLETGGCVASGLDQDRAGSLTAQQKAQIGITARRLQGWPASTGGGVVYGEVVHS